MREVRAVLRRRLGLRRTRRRRARAEGHDLLRPARARRSARCNPDGSEQRVVFGVPPDLADPDDLRPDAVGDLHLRRQRQRRPHPPRRRPRPTRTTGTPRPASWSTRSAAPSPRSPATDPTADADWYVDALGLRHPGQPRRASPTRSDRAAFSYRFDLAKRRWRIDSIDAGRRDTVPTRSAARSRPATARARSPRPRSTRCTGRSASGPATTPRAGDAAPADRVRRRAATPTSPPPSAPPPAARNLLGRPVAPLRRGRAASPSPTSTSRATSLDVTRRVIADAPDPRRLRERGRRRLAGHAVPGRLATAAGQTWADATPSCWSQTGYATTHQLRRPQPGHPPRPPRGRRRRAATSCARPTTAPEGWSRLRLDDTVYVERDRATTPRASAR